MASGALHPGAPATRTRRGQITALLSAGGVEACRDLLLTEISTGPTGFDWCRDVAEAVLAADDLRTAAALVDLLARTERGSTRRPARWSTGRPFAPPVTPPPRPASAATLHHDADQFALLRRRGLIGPEFDPVIAEYRALADRLARTGGRLTELDSGAAAGIAHVYNRIVHVVEAPRVARALAAGWSAADVEAQYLTRTRGLAVVDDVLTPTALAGLLRFCQESTVWSDARAGDGRLGAWFADGFTCPLLVQVAEEVRARLPVLLADRALVDVSGATSAAGRPATPRSPRERSALTVGFWITPIASDPDSNPDSDLGGGLLVGDDRATVVPYRGNRAVVLDTARPAWDDAVRGAPGHEHRRLEITLHFGAARPDVG